MTGDNNNQKFLRNVARVCDIFSSFVVYMKFTKYINLGFGC